MPRKERIVATGIGISRVGAREGLVYLGSMTLDCQECGAGGQRRDGVLHKGIREGPLRPG